MDKLTQFQAEEVHRILKADGFPCNESGAERWLLKRGFTQEELKNMPKLEDKYLKIFYCEQIPF